MYVLRRRVRRVHNRLPDPSMVMVDTQVVKGGRAGRTARPGKPVFTEVVRSIDD